ncbi:MAG TPA: universal stress protein [Pseudonocardiaceae bacterium]|nr:universal stress protein [Pseudonocardiaceae bacterium]
MTEQFRPDDPAGPIVVGVDGSRFSRAALRWAIVEGRRTQNIVVALMSWRADPVTGVGRPVVAGLPSHPRQAPEPRFQQFLDDTVREVVADVGGPVPIARVVPGSAMENLVDASREAWLLVLGSHGHGRLFDALVGSVAEYCVRNAVCPVVIIPALLAEPVAHVIREPRLVPDAYVPDVYGL